MDNEAQKGYTWETEYERTWEALQEDESGSLQASIQGIVHRAKRKHLEGRKSNIRLGIMRHMFVIVDMSEAMKNPDLKPSRAVLSLKLLEGFVEEFFDQNPISQLGVIMTMNKRAEKCTDLGGNPRKHLEKLQSMCKLQCQGEPSLLNSLELALQTLRHLPSHTSREILVIMGSLTTCDPSNISETIAKLCENRVRCSVIGLAAAVCVCQKLATTTGGEYDVIMDEHHFKDLLHHHITPPPSQTTMESSLIRMGFPFHKSNESADARDNNPSMCMCHLDAGNQIEKYFSCTGYYCPQCKSKYCELPVECKACGLTLVSAPHLARSYRHLFPLAPFREVTVTSLSDDVTNCYACRTALDDSGSHVYQCEKCDAYFCNDCDTFIHDSLQTCPSCASAR